MICNNIDSMIAMVIFVGINFCSVELIMKMAFHQMGDVQLTTDVSVQSNRSNLFLFSCFTKFECNLFGGAYSE